LSIFLPILLAESIKTAHKKADLFQNRLFYVFWIFIVLLSG